MNPLGTVKRGLTKRLQGFGGHKEWQKYRYRL
jgi:hypothetical protein